MRLVNCGGALLTVALAFASVTSADLLFESGALGPTGLTRDDFGSEGDPDGAVVSGNVFNGVRFELAQAVNTTRIGGHFVNNDETDDSFFGAIVLLDDEADFPDSNDLSSDDVLGATLLTFPEASTEVFGDLELLLSPGWHALVFGSGLFGATGTGAAVLNNPDFGSPSYIALGPNLGWFNHADLGGAFKNFRFVVQGTVIPEPSSTILTLIGLSCSSFLWPARRKRRT